ncbi:MAG TPA: prolipoprotein diacylglyceryl transferase [Trueperaceae bacterium]|nr:prolipoprotein diacylglyceryl transferase [Trueperaceae bacterium]
MDPIMVHIGPLAIRWYGFLIALAVLIGALWGLRLAERRGLDPDKLLDSAVWLVLAGIIGARLVYVVTSPSAFFGPGGHPLDAFKVWQGGISIHGGILGVLFAMWLYSRSQRINMWAYMDVLTPLGALGIMAGRIGNIMNGTDTGGRLTDLAIGIDWPKPGTPFLDGVGRAVFGKELWRYAPPACSTVPVGQPCHIHFAQAYGFLVGFLVLFIVLWALRHSRAPGYAFWQFALWYSVLRSLLEEPFRDNPLFWKVYDNAQAGIGFFTLTQLASIPIVLFSIYMLWRIHRRERRSARPAGGD